MKDLSMEEKKTQGVFLKELKDEVEDAYNSKLSELTIQAINKKLINDPVDLSLDLPPQQA